jgi:RNA polymerase sigma-70 factor (ECF subfamily)
MEALPSRQASPVALAIAPLKDVDADALGEFRALFDAELRYVWTSLGRLGIPERDREDLASEVFFRVHRRMADLDRTRPVRPWLFAFAARVASEHRKRAQTRNETLGATDDAGAGAVEPPSASRSDDDRELVCLALESLDFDKRTVFVMHFLDGFTAPEIARSLDIPLGTAYTRLRAARDLFTAAVRRIRKAQP